MPSDFYFLCDWQNLKLTDGEWRAFLWICWRLSGCFCLTVTLSLQIRHFLKWATPITFYNLCYQGSSPQPLGPFRICKHDSRMKFLPGFMFISLDDLFWTCHQRAGMSWYYRRLQIYYVPVCGLGKLKCQQLLPKKSPLLFDLYILLLIVTGCKANNQLFCYLIQRFVFDEHILWNEARIKIDAFVEAF